jgi:hypothetical protein
MAVMKRIYFICLSLLLAPGVFAQSEKTIESKGEKNEVNSSFTGRKEKGFYNIMHVSLLFGSNLYSGSSNSSYFLTNLVKAPSFTTTNGYIFNKHWSAGAGIGLEIFNYNLFPLFAELRYTFWDHEISPFVVLKSGYSFAGFKARHFDDLNLDWPPYNINDATIRNYGGFLLNPEVGVKVPLNENTDLLFTAAYRYLKTKSVVRKENTFGQFEEWEHNEWINRLSLGIAVMFR